jgi:formylglycine-generating enzyme required for sulfatase activity
LAECDDGATYRLLSEAEWEYAARAGRTTPYFWGSEVGKNNANCNGCGSQWDNRQTSPVGSFASNAFGLSGMAGNVWQWVDDCYRDSYKVSDSDLAPSDGSEWKTTESCSRRVVRGGSWNYAPGNLRAAVRYWSAPELRVNILGFRVARTLTP